MKEQKEIELVNEFYESFNIPKSDTLTLLSKERAKLRFELMQEENKEYANAVLDENIVEVADALGDQLFVLLGTILEHGLQHKIKEVFHEIHRSNMSKLDENGNPIYREDGKILKGKDYFKPHIESILFKKD